MIQPLQLFRVLADETRLRCVLLVHAERELCVCELVCALGVIQPKVSRHLAALRDAGVLVDRRDGQWVYYRLSEHMPKWAVAVINAAAVSEIAAKWLRRDQAALRKMTNRPDGGRCT